MSDDSVRVDLHVHSKHSTDSGNYALRRARLGESYTEPERVHRVCKQRGMRFVTISDHNTLEGALRIAHLPDTFLSVEITTCFPEDDVILHVLAWGLTEEDHRDLQPCRASVYELVALLRERNVAHALAHPLYRMGPPITPWHVERMLLLFSLWEGRNGARPEESNALAVKLAGLASGDRLARLAEQHGLAPAHDGRIGLTGGSDDHGALDIATTWTVGEGSTVESFLTGLRARVAEPGGEHGSTTKLAHAMAALAANAYRDTGAELSPLVAGSLGALFDEDAHDASQRHDEIRLTTSTLARGLAARGREGGLGLSGLTTLGPRLASFVYAGALEVPYLATANHHAGSRKDLRAVESHFFGQSARARQVRSIVFTDTYDEANGVAGTMRRLAGEGAHGALPVRVATARAAAPDEAGVLALAADWTLPLPAYEHIELRFPLVTDVLARVEEEAPDVIHVATPGPVGVCGLIAAKLLGLPLVGSYHTELGPYALHLTRDILVAQAMDLWVDWFYRQCELVLAPTEAVADALRARGVARTAVWGRGVDTQLFTPTRRFEPLRDHLLEDPALGRGDLLLLSVGRVSNEKRVDVLVEAVRRLRETHPGVRLVVVGDGPARADLEAAAPAGVTFLGELRGKELAQVYASADVFCFPSTTDTFGQVILEASACALPVVAARAGGAAELVRDRLNGLLVLPDDPGALAAALSELADDGKLRHALGRRALASAQARTWSRAYDELVAAYAAAVGVPHPAPQLVAA